MIKSEISSRGHTIIGIMVDGCPEPALPTPSIAYSGTSVGGAIVNYDNFKIRLALPRHTIKARVKIPVHIVDRYNQ